MHCNLCIIKIKWRVFIQNISIKFANQYYDQDAGNYEKCAQQ